MLKPRNLLSLRHAMVGIAASFALVGLLGTELHAQAAGDALFAKTHKGAKEAKVSGDWYKGLPKWVASLTSKNNFPKTHLLYEFAGDKLKPSKGPNKFEIRDANEKQFSAYELVRDGTDGNGLPVFKASGKSAWVEWRGWPAKYILETYPVEGNTDTNDLVGFAAWLYTQKENDLANRVLTVAHKLATDTKPLIEAYICEKEKWVLPAEGLVQWKYWDVEYQRERLMLLTPDERTKREANRKKDFEAAYKGLITARGDYKGRPPRRVSPTKQLVLIDWEIRQFKIAYEDLLKDDAKRNDELTAITDSIKDDLTAIKDNKTKANEMAASGQPNDLKKKAEYMEEILKIDPMDLNLRSEVANAWYIWGNPAPHGNSCDRADGIKAAIPHYKIILEAYPSNTGILLALGRCYQALESSKEARGYYDKVIELEGTKGNGPTAKALIRNMEDKDRNRAQSGGK